MWRKFFGITLALIIVSCQSNTKLLAQTESTSDAYVTLVTLVRGKSRWINQEQNWLAKHQDLYQIHNFQSTWLLDYDAIIDKSITTSLAPLETKSDIGLFLEVTPELARKLNLSYDFASPPHKPHNAFLSGYSLADRKKIIDFLVSQFKLEFSRQPTSVGAWFIDSWSLKYLNSVYEIDAVLLVAEQYGTDHHTIRGHTWQEAYYPSQTNVLTPGSKDNQLESVIVQWAAREPLRGYGFYREHSNYSVQANDYTQQGLEVDYFNELIDTYLINKDAPLKQLTIGIEVGQEGAEYFKEYSDLIEALSSRDNLQVTTLNSFANTFKSTFDQNPALRFSQWQSETQDEWAGWITTTSYRLGITAKDGDLTIRDLRVYSQNQDDSWMYADSRHDLFRQTEAIIDQVGLQNSWLLSSDLQVASPEIDSSTDELSLSFGDVYLRFKEKSVETNLDLLQMPNPLITLEKNNLDSSRLHFNTLEVSKSRNYFVILMLLSTFILVALLAYLKAEYSWYLSVVVALIGISLLDLEIWLLTPLNDLGFNYFFASNPALFVTKLIAYGLTPLVLTSISIGLFAYSKMRTKSICFSLSLQWAFLLGSGLGWLFPLYRQLPLDSSLITGTKTNLTSFIWWFKLLDLSRLEFAFSAGQMHIEPLAKLVSSQLFLVPALAFVIANWGILLVGFAYLVLLAVKNKSYIKLFALFAVLALVASSTNSLDVRAPTVFDLGLSLICVWGIIELAFRLKLKSWSTFFLSIILFVFTLPGTVSLIERNNELSFRLNTHWSDRGKTIHVLQQKNRVQDVFLPKNKAIDIFIPMGIQDYSFIDPVELKKGNQILLENSYGVVIQDN